MMTWKSFLQPGYIWDRDNWERGTDGKVFIAVVKMNCWLCKDGEKIKFDNGVIIGRCV